MELIETIRTTGSIREFTDQPVSDELIFQILDDARFAPSGVNRQAWHVIVVRDRLVRQAVHVLLEAVPEHIDLAEVFAALKALSLVREVHALHIWTISHNLHALSAHLVCAGEGADRDELLVRARAMLREKFDIDHATLQIESEQLASRERSP